MSRENVYEKFEVEYLTVKIVNDESPSNPRDDHSGSLFFGWHKRYLCGDDPTKHGMPNAHHLREVFPDGWDEIRAHIEEHFKPRCILPVFMYDHGGVAYSTGSFGCSWDSGQIGFIFTHGPDDDWEDPEAALKALVEEYSEWASGNVWGYVVENSEGDVESSCWGFIGDPDKSGVIEEARASAKWLIERERREAQRCADMVRL